ncbi:cephalotocin receptor 1-like [Mercenaria mercenaria]|uniref:cephalotocin receptor 1-like n=1 Tax=Mercenaria mercenaria TaxID=6596 RepID=UPI00234E67FA|nr:cephalotocin receptor 1-like [Mercenaria mercenaria]
METSTNITTNLTSNSSLDNSSTFIYPASPIGPEFFKAYNIYLYLMIVFGVLGNFIVLVVFIRHPPSNSTDWFILFITIYDFISSLLNVPVYATFTNGYWRVYGTTILCRLHMFLSQSLVLSSAFLISGLALDRYLKICRQLTSFSKRRARNVCLLISIVTAFLSTPCFVMYENRAGRCVSIVMDKTLFAYYLMVFLIFIFATAVVVLSYFKVTKAVKISEENVLRHTGHIGHSGHNGHTVDDMTNKALVCCLPSYRKNRVAPSTTATLRSGLFRDTIIAASSIEPSCNSGSVPTVMDKDRLQVPKQPNKSPRVTSTSGHIVEPTSNNSLTPSTILSERKSKDARLISLRTTKISFLHLRAKCVEATQPKTDMTSEDKSTHKEVEPAQIKADYADVKK